MLTLGHATSMIITYFYFGMLNEVCNLKSEVLKQSCIGNPYTNNP